MSVLFRLVKGFMYGVVVSLSCYRDTSERETAKA